MFTHGVLRFGVVVLGCAALITALGGCPPASAPAVNSTDPADGAIGVSFNKKISATFSEAMDPATITPTTFTVTQGTAPVSGTVACADTTATFTPAGNLTPNTTYTATVSTEATNLAGNTLASDLVWTFTTEAKPAEGTGSETLGVYPDLANSAYGTDNPFCPKYCGQCTAFAWGRAKEKLGITLECIGNAATWWDCLDESFLRGPDPKADSIAVWTDGQFGHVAFVESVNDNDNEVTFNEANWHTYKDTDEGGGYDLAPETLTIQEMQTRGKSATYHLSGYVYLR